MAIQAEMIATTSSVTLTPFQWLFFVATYCGCALICRYIYLGGVRLFGVTPPKGLCLGTLICAQSQRWHHAILWRESQSQELKAEVNALACYWTTSALC
jgi:hypothetical protein